MELKYIKNRLITLSIIILVLCILHTIVVYMATKPPEFTGLISTRLLGADETNIFIEMTWNVKNVSLFPYILDNTHLFFHEQELQIAQVFPADAALINAFADSKIKVRATINRDVFERLIRNSIDYYSFDLRGTAEARFLWLFSKELEMSQHIPIEINALLSTFLQDSFRNAIYFEQIIITESAVDCIIAFVNRTGFEMEIRGFESNIQIGRTNSGHSDYFYPVHFRPDERMKTTRIRFQLQNTLIDRNFSQRYFLDGYLTIGLWEREYTFPMRLIGEN